MTSSTPTQTPRKPTTTTTTTTQSVVVVVQCSKKVKTGPEKGPNWKQVDWITMKME